MWIGNLIGSDESAAAGASVAAGAAVVAAAAAVVAGAAAVVAGAAPSASSLPHADTTSASAASTAMNLIRFLVTFLSPSNRIALPARPITLLNSSDPKSL